MESGKGGREAGREGGRKEQRERGREGLKNRSPVPFCTVPGIAPSRTQSRCQEKGVSSAHGDYKPLSSLRPSLSETTGNLPKDFWENPSSACVFLEGGWVDVTLARTLWIISQGHMSVILSFSLPHYLFIYLETQPALNSLSSCLSLPSVPFLFHPLPW